MLLRVRGGMEAHVHMLFRERGVRSYYPKYLERTRAGMEAFALFPGYLFVWVSAMAWHIADTTMDAFGFVSFGDQSVELVPSAVIERYRLLEGPTGYIDRDLGLDIGDTVRHKGGMEGEFLGVTKDRTARVGVQILGEQIEFKVFYKDLDLVAA